MCFSLGWWEQLFVWAIIVCAIIAIINLLIPYVLAQVGSLGTAGALIVAALRIVFWAVVAIVVVYIIFALISCLIGMGGGLPMLHGR